MSLQEDAKCNPTVFVPSTSPLTLLRAKRAGRIVYAHNAKHTELLWPKQTVRIGARVDDDGACQKKVGKREPS